MKHRFQLTPKNFPGTVQAKPNCMAVQQEFKCSMTQLQINSKDVTTGHKLQGISKYLVLISSLPTGGLFKKGGICCSLKSEDKTWFISF